MIREQQGLDECYQSTERGRIDDNWQLEVTLDKFAVGWGNLEMEIETNPYGLNHAHENSEIEMK